MTVLRYITLSTMAIGIICVMVAEKPRNIAKRSTVQVESMKVHDYVSTYCKQMKADGYWKNKPLYDCVSQYKRAYQNSPVMAREIRKGWSG